MLHTEYMRHDCVLSTAHADAAGSCWGHALHVAVQLRDCTVHAMHSVRTPYTASCASMKYISHRSRSRDSVGRTSITFRHSFTIFSSSGPSSW